MQAKMKEIFTSTHLFLSIQMSTPFLVHITHRLRHRHLIQRNKN